MALNCYHRPFEFHMLTLCRFCICVIHQAKMVVAAGNDTSALLEALVYSVNIRARVGYTTGGHT